MKKPVAARHAVPLATAGRRYKSVFVRMNNVLRSLITRPVIGRLSMQGLFALAGVAGPIILVAADNVAARSALSGSNYDLIRDSISILARMPMGWIQTLGFLVIGLLVEGFAVGLLLSIRRAIGFKFSIILLSYFGFGLLLIGAFHTDIPSEPTTIDGTIHLFAADTIFLALPLASLFMAPSLKIDPDWRPLFPCSVIMASVSLVWILVYKVWLPEELSWFGLYERILVLTEILWVEVMAIWLLHLSLKNVENSLPPTDDSARIN